MARKFKSFFSLILAVSVVSVCLVIPHAQSPAPITEITFDKSSELYSLQDGAAITDGEHSGNALSLNGATAYASLSDASKINSPTGDFTISIWCNPTATTQWSRLFDFGAGTDKYMFLTFSGDRPRFAITLGGNASGAEQVLDGTRDVVLGEWNNIIITRTGAVTKMYINGVEAGATDGITLSPADLGTTTTNYFGKSQYPDPYFSGMLDDFAVYDTGITEAQAQEIAGVAYKRELENIAQQQLVQIASHDKYDIKTSFYNEANEKIFQLSPSKAQTITAKIDITNYTLTDGSVSAALSSGGRQLAKSDIIPIDCTDSAQITLTASIPAAQAKQLNVTVTDETLKQTFDAGYIGASDIYFPNASPEDSDETTFGAHDPTIFKDPIGGHYWAYSTHNLVYESTDLINWVEHDYTKTLTIPKKCEDFIYNNYADLGIDKNSDSDNKRANATYWAPDIIYKEGDEYPYWFYLSVSCGLGGRNSVIGLVKAKSPGLWDGETKDCGVVLATREEKDYVTNAIDANLYTDTDGAEYFIWGSFWGGIQAAKLLDDGRVEGVDYSSEAAVLESCKNVGTTVFATKRGVYGPEGPYMINNADTGYRYMFTSYGWLGTNYNIRVARSPLSSPFASSMTSLADANGNKVASAYNDSPDNELWGYKASGSYQLGDGIEYCGSGHNSVFKDDDGSWYLVEHCRKIADAAAYLQVRKLLWTADGWPVVSPVVYAGEREQKIPEIMLYGTWDLSSVGRTIFRDGVTTVTTSSKDADLPVHSSEIVLMPDGKLDDNKGTWSFDGDYTVTLSFSKNRDERENEYYKNGDVMKLFVMTGYDKDKRESCVTMTGIDQNHITQFAKKSNASVADTTPAALKTTSKTLPKSSGGNPILGFDQNGNLLYGGDPAAAVIGDTVYLYVGHDNSTDEELAKAIYNMPEWVCYTSKNMTDWKYEGVVMSASDISWAKDATSAWASQMQEYKGKYYLYFCTWDKTDNGKQSIGVAVADSPKGPFKDIGHPLVKGSITMPQTSDWNDIDPTVLIDTIDGTEHRYLAWGNGKYYVCELNEDMISVKDQNSDGKIDMNDIKEQKFLNMHNASFTEAPWLYKRGNKYYTFFAANWRECMAYAVADTPYGPWQYGGLIMPPTATSNTNHPSVIDFNGKTYFIYHNGSLPAGCGYRRSVCVSELFFDENGLVCPVTETSTGLSGTANVLKTMDGKYVAHAPFENSRGDSFYPISKPLITSNAENGLNTAWEIVKPLNNASGSEYASIQSVDKPGLYLAAVDGTLILTQNADGKMADQMTFRSVNGLSGMGISFESVSEKGKYITALGGSLVLSYGRVKDVCTFTTADITPTPAPTAALMPTATPVPTLSPDTSENFENAPVGDLIQMETDEPSTYEKFSGVSLYIKNREAGADPTSKFSIEEDKEHGKVLKLNGGRFPNMDRGGRVTLVTPAIIENSAVFASMKVKLENGTGGEAKLFYGDSASAQATADTFLTDDGAWHSVSVTITNSDGLITRIISVDDNVITTDGAKRFPIFWGTGEKDVYANVYFDDIKVMSENASHLVTSVDGGDISVRSSNGSAVVYAVKQENGGKVNILPVKSGDATVTASFDPDKVLIWSKFPVPYVMWSKK